MSDNLSASNKIKPNLQINGKGLFSKDEVIVSINNAEINSGITFCLNNEKINANINNVSNTARNTVLSKKNETICLIEHFLAACSVLGINDINVLTNKNELVFDDGSAIHWYELFKKANLVSKVSKKYELKNPLFVKKDDKSIVAIPFDGFKVSYFMDYNHPALGKLFASWERDEDPVRLLRARTFAKKEENDFFGVSGRILSLTESSFDMELYEVLEPAYHKILDIIGDLSLCGVNPLEINMHVISFKGGHDINVEMARELNKIPMILC